MTAVPSAVVSSSSRPSTTWILDTQHTQIGFRVRHMLVSWSRGHFEKFTGTVVFDDEQPENAIIDVTIDAASVNTNLADRDEHLRSADFFDVKNHPTLGFRSSKVERSKDGGLRVAGELTVRGVTRPVVLDVAEIGPATKDPWGGIRRGASASARISRKEFGLNWNAALEAGGVVLGDEVQIQVEIELIKA